MLILSLDTTTRTASCALMRDGTTVSEIAIDAATQVAVQMPGVLQTLLEGAGVALREVDAFAVATGPGSFTGLRIGIAAMQGLAFAEGKPLIGISALDALAAIARITNPESAIPTEARQIPNPQSPIPTVITLVDAWRGDVYAALYEGGDAPEPTIAKPEAFLGDLVRGSGRVRATGEEGARAAGEMVFIGDGANSYRELILSTLGDTARIADPAAPLLAAAIALLAAEVYAAGHRPPPHAIRPLYVRRPDVEIKRGLTGPAQHPVGPAHGVGPST